MKSMKTKICKKCKLLLIIKYFGKGNDKDNLSFRCKQCNNKYAKKYYNAHKKMILKKHKLYKLLNIKRIRKQNKIYQKNYRLTPISIYFHIKENAKRRKYNVSFTKKEFINWYNKQKQVCYYCNRTLKEIQRDKKAKLKRTYRLTIERKNNKEGYNFNNITLCCWRCNIIKGDYFTEKEMMKLSKILYKK